MTNGFNRAGWHSWVAKLAMAALLSLALTGLAVTFAPFHAAVQWGLLLHTAVGLLTLAPISYYYAVHWQAYRNFAFSHIVLLGYVGLVALFLCSLSGLVVTWQGLFATRMSPAWRTIHLVTTFAVLGTALPHVVLTILRARRTEARPLAWRYVRGNAAALAGGTLFLAVLPLVYSGTRYVNEFPEDYNFLYGEDRPFAPSLALTSTGGAFDARSLAGSATCGSSGCHEEIYKEWLPSAHRYAAKDPLFQDIQAVMAKQNGPESTRYCSGCHDPISLFSGTKNIFVENLTNLQGYNEGVSCVACHAIQKTDIRGNANFTISQPSEYLWQWREGGAGKVARDFLIRTYPEEHNKLTKRMYKTPEYCAACHKQFIDQEVNRVGWVQLQNQYDNWKASHWYTKGDPRKTVECRECHMPLAPNSKDPAAGDPSDYNRSRNDGMHRSHRFIAANNMMPEVLKLEGWEEQVELTNRWLKGEFEIPEIAHKWAEGPIVRIAVGVPAEVGVRQNVPIRVVLTSNKVGHDFPTGPLDLIQSWVELRVTNEAGEVVYASGRLDERDFIEPGSFLFKAEPVDQYGNLIDRHNLWEMVGVRYRRSLFPGYSDTAEFLINCSGAGNGERAGNGDSNLREFSTRPLPAGRYEVTAMLNYRKVDQFLLNYFYGDRATMTAPVVEISRATATFEVKNAPSRN